MGVVAFLRSAKVPGQGAVDVCRMFFMRRNKKILVSLIVALFLLIPEVSGATELYETFRSVRALGMGNAYVSVVRDSDSLFFNPAGLALDTGVYWTIADPGLGLNGAEALTEVQNFQSSGDFATALSNLNGKKIWAGGVAKSAVRLPFFAVAYFYTLDAGISVLSTDTPQLDVNYINDTGYAAGFGVPILPFVYFGAAVRQFTRKGNRRLFTAAETAVLDSTTFDAAIANEGTALGVDVGLTIAINTIITPAVSFVVRNLGSTTFSATGSASAPPGEEEEWILGASLTTDLGLISFSPSLDLKHLNKPDEPLTKKIHVGFELGLPFIDIRAGLHQSYWSAGVGLGLGPLQVDVASYGVELGDADNTIEDRRYLLQATIEFGMSMGGGSSGGGSSSGKGGTRSRRSRGLKQRR